MDYLTTPLYPGAPKAARLVLGTLYFGTEVPQKQAHALLEQYIDAGGNNLDTARGYASWLPNGEGASERCIGTFLRANPGLRPSLLIGSKGGLAPRGANPYRASLSPQSLRRELEASLTDLQTDYLDVYWLHRDDPRLPVEKILETLHGFYKEGLVKSVAVSNWKSARIEEANHCAEKAGMPPLVASQVQYSLAQCTNGTWGDETVVCMDDEQAAWYTKAALPVFCYSSLAQGYFNTLLEQGEDALDDDVRTKYHWGPNPARATRLQNYCKQHGATLTQGLLAYVLAAPFETTALAGCDTPGRLADALGWQNTPMDSTTHRWLKDGDQQEDSV